MSESQGPAKSIHWNQERDNALIQLVHKLGTKKWSVIVDKMK